MGTKQVLLAEHEAAQPNSKHKSPKHRMSTNIKEHNVTERNVTGHCHPSNRKHDMYHLYVSICHLRIPEGDTGALFKRSIAHGLQCIWGLSKSTFAS